MKILGAKKRGFMSFLNDRSGNLALLTAFALPAGLAAGGVALDLANMLAVKAKLQAAADAGATAAAAALANEEMTISEAKALALSFVRGQLHTELDEIDAQLAANETDFDFGDCTNADITETAGYGNTKTYDVTVNTCLTVQLSAMNAFLDAQEKTIYVKAAAEGSTGSQKALSMYLVLDRSGSMAWDTTTETGTESYRYKCGWGTYCTGTRTTYLSKIDALKAAATALLDQINEADPDALYARLGAVSYNSYMWTPEDFSWGTANVASYVDALTANGGTDSSNAVREAYRELSDGVEETVHGAKNGQTPDKYIVFMTDGDNNYSTADTSTKGWCNDAKAAGIEIYTVAFMAPEGGQALLSDCATDSDHYFNASDADEMIAAFKYIGEKATESTARLTQ